jgi:hypothetical protein
MKIFFLNILFPFLFLNVAFAQIEVSGFITNFKNEPIPFVSVYINNTTKGVSANADGFYKISLAKNETSLKFKAMGFKALDKSIDQQSIDLVINVKLVEESFTLQDVEIKATVEDPAYAIIRNAIKNRSKHLNEIDSYSVDVYTKGLQKIITAPKKFLGRDVRKTLNLDANRQGILYLSESRSKFAFKRPKQIHEEMISSKVAGNSAAFSINKASDLLVNFYNNLLLDGSGLSSRSFISPIAENAMFYYRYKLLGKSVENEITINKVEVIPRRGNDPVFRGIIYIADGSWHITGTNLNLTDAAGINFVDTLNISQQFTKTENTYLPVDTKFQFNGKVLGFKFEGYFVGIFSNYNLNPNFPKNYFTAEVLKVNKYVNKKDSLYWMNNRPIPLTEEEKIEYKKKDSIAILKQSKPYLDSLEQTNNQFGIGKFILRGYVLNNRYYKRKFAYDSFLTSVFYNTVEGLALKYGVTYTKDMGDKKNFTIRPEMRYGFKSHLFVANLKTSYDYDPTKRASVGMSLGSDIADLNKFGSNSLRSNTINSLLFETNLSKFYKKEFININTTREIADGLQANLQVDYNINYTLKNNTNFTFRDIDDKVFTSNNPFTPTEEAPLFPTYRSFSLTASLNYTIGQKYITRPDGKFYQESKYPRFTVTYKKGIKNIFSSDIDYNFVSIEVYQEKIKMGLFGYSSFVLGAGNFVDKQSIYYPDSKHFWGNSSTLFPPNLRRFRYLDFYLYATQSQYFEGHFEHNFAGFVTNKIPLLRKLKLEEFAGINYLSTPEKKNYTEYYFGLQRLVLSISYGWAYDGNKKVEQGFRIAYGF